LRRLSSWRACNDPSICQTIATARITGHVGFRAGTAAGSPTIEVRIETLDASGLPSGTLWATNTNGTTGTVSSNTYVLWALTASASIAKGQMFCVRAGVWHQSGDFKHQQFGLPFLA
jgi:hypothetical protein